MKKFVRKGWFRYSKLGKRRKKKQVWRRPSGRDNKMREKRRGYPVVVSIGYGSNKREKNKINGMKPIRIEKLKDLEKMKEGNIGVIGKMGKKKKMKIAKIIESKKIKIFNLNTKKILKKEKNESK